VTLAQKGPGYLASGCSVRRYMTVKIVYSSKAVMAPAANCSGEKYMLDEGKSKNQS
jgi:hypothetical protein